MLLGTLFLLNTATSQAQTTIWSATLTVDDRIAGTTIAGCSGDCATRLTQNSFTHGNATFTITAILLDSNNQFYLRFDRTVPDSLKPFTLRVDTSEFALSAASYQSTGSLSNNQPVWDNSGMSWTANQQVQLSLVEPPPTPTVSLSAPSSVPEGENVTVTATLSEALSHYVQIPLLPAWNTGTVETGDIKGPPGTISVYSGSTTGETIVLAVRDCDREDETFIVALNTDTLPSSLRAGTQSSVTITITDDGTEWCDSRPPQNTGGTTTGGGGGGGGFGGGGNEPPPEDEEPTASCPREDREILGSFYEMTDGESWDEDKNWNSEEPLGEWHGVETDEDGNVVSLRLEDNNLSGDMPTRELLCLKDKELVELALWGNDGLSGEVPDELVLAVERAALRYIAEMLDINPEWFEDYGDPYDFEDWHEGVTTDDGRVTGLDFTEEGVTGEIPENIFELLPRLGEIMVTRSSEDGGCAVGASSERMGASALLAAIFMLLTVSRGLRARSY